MTRAALAGLVLILTPRSASACATCISSPFGDQSYTWPYLGLILLPFGLIVAIAGVLGYLNWKARLGRRRLLVSLTSGLAAPASGRPCGSHCSPATTGGAHRHRYGPRTIVRRLGSYFGAKDDPQIIKETT